MEAVGAFRIFGRSLIKRDLQYTEYYGDGDSKGFLQVNDIYGENSVTKLECNYYGIVIRSNVGCLEKMQSAIIDAFFHCCSSNQNPMHEQCPTGKDSWCKYKQALCDDSRRNNAFRFIEWAQNEIAVVPDFHKRIWFRKEAHFWLNGYVNKQNCRICSEANPQVYVETPLHPEKLTVWSCGSNKTEQHVHTARATIAVLKDTFGDRLISRFGPVNWPPRSCDLTPLDYFLWVYVKSLVYANKPQTLDHLEDNIRRVIADIRPQMLEKVIENWTSRLDYIRDSRGSPMPEIIFKM
ncbi:putative transposable element [Trichonephila clavipes]|nr:putative transposable element [Trichonephila clavipes]